MDAELTHTNKTERRMQDQNMALVAARLENFESSFDELKSDMRKMAEAVTKLAIVEERQATANAAQNRAFEAIKAVEGDAKALSGRITSLEIANANTKRIAAWIDRGTLGALGILALFIAQKSGLL